MQKDHEAEKKQWESATKDAKAAAKAVTKAATKDARASLKAAKSDNGALQLEVAELKRDNDALEAEVAQLKRSAAVQHHPSPLRFSPRLAGRASERFSSSGHAARASYGNAIDPARIEEFRLFQEFTSYPTRSSSGRQSSTGL